MLNRLGSFPLAGVGGLLMLLGVACGPQAPTQVTDPSTVQSPPRSEPLAITSTLRARPESTAPVQEGSEPAPPVRIAATEKPRSDVEFLMTAALDALSDQDGPPAVPRSFFEPPWASELRRVALQMSTSGNTVYIPLIIDFMRIQFSQEARVEYAS